MDKYLKKALITLNVIGAEQYKNIEDFKGLKAEIELAIEDAKSSMIEYAEWIEESKKAILTAEKQVELIDSIIHQVKVERYQELNKGKEVF